MIKNHIIYNDYSNWRFDISKAKGSYIWKKDGTKMIDFTSGWNVTNLGWNNEEIAEYVAKLTREKSYAPTWTADKEQEDYAKLLVESLPDELDAIGRATGGTEANEEAIKTARAYTGRSKILGFKNTYHGQSFGTLAVGYLPKYVKKISPLVGDFVQMNFPNTYRTDLSESNLLEEFSKELDTLLSKEDIAAIVCEAGIITGWGSAYVAPNGFVKIVRELTEKYGTLLILDEVGTGFSRLGELFGMQVEGIVPDIATFAKGISNGVAPIGAMVTSNEIAEKSFPDTNLTSTFGWIPLACAAAKKTLEIHLREKPWIKAKEDGEYILKTLKEKLDSHPNVGDIRGIGMEIGVDFVKDKKTKEKDADLVDKVVAKAEKSGLHIVCDHDSNVQIMPPLTIDRKTLDAGLEIFIEVVNNS